MIPNLFAHITTLKIIPKFNKHVPKEGANKTLLLFNIATNTFITTENNTVGKVTRSNFTLNACVISLNPGANKYIMYSAKISPIKIKSMEITIKIFTRLTAKSFATTFPSLLKIEEYNGTTTECIATDTKANRFTGTYIAIA